MVLVLFGNNFLIDYLAIEDKLIDDPRNIIYDGLYFEVKDLLRYPMALFPAIYQIYLLAPFCTYLLDPS